MLYFKWRPEFFNCTEVKNVMWASRHTFIHVTETVSIRMIPNLWTKFCRDVHDCASMAVVDESINDIHTTIGFHRRWSDHIASPNSANEIDQCELPDIVSNFVGYRRRSSDSEFKVLWRSHLHGTRQTRLDRYQ